METLKHKIDILQLEEWGWFIKLHRDPKNTCIEITTPLNAGYSLTVDAHGNVVEYISGSYTRVVGGNVVERTMGCRVDDTGGPSIVRSDDYVAFSAPEIHLNPEELKGPLQSVIPSELEKG